MLDYVVAQLHLVTPLHTERGELSKFVIYRFMTLLSLFLSLEGQKCHEAAPVVASHR